nr:hypothetical protein [uncultured bacterium]
MLAFRTVTYCTENEETPFSNELGGRPFEPYPIIKVDIDVKLALGGLFNGGGSRSGVR